jgi:ABC-2 type transport system permease protein
VSRLLRVELRRLRSRRLVRWSVLVVFLGVLAAPALVPWAFNEQARINHDADIERCVQAKPPKARDGVTLPTISPDVAAPASRERRCREVTPTVDPDFHLRQLDEIYRTTAALLVIGGFLVGASSIGADWQAGLIPTVLTWEGRRLRIFAARLIALVTAVFAAVIAWQGLLAATVLPYTLVEGTTDETGGDWVRTISGLGLRVAVIAAAAAAFGFALALLGRGTAAALGVGFAYLFVFENVVGSQFKPLRPWLMLWNGLVFVKGTFEAGGDVPNRTVVAAAVILTVWAVVIVVGAGVVFQRRDVT